MGSHDLHGLFSPSENKIIHPLMSSLIVIRIYLKNNNFYLISNCLGSGLQSLAVSQFYHLLCDFCKVKLFSSWFSKVKNGDNTNTHAHRATEWIKGDNKCKEFGILPRVSQMFNKHWLLLLWRKC